MSVDFKGYHACSREGGYETVRKCIPFLSEDGPDQWLTQGYYFWYNSARYAETWIPSEYRKGGSKYGQQVERAIGLFQVSIPKDKFWDLVGEPKHQDEFSVFAKRVLNKYKRAGKSVVEVSTNEVITEMRLMSAESRYENVFPYVAIKAVDERKSAERYKFSSVKGSAGNTHSMAIGNAQQVCVFQSARDSFQLTSFHSPYEFKLQWIKERETSSQEEGQNVKS